MPQDPAKPKTELTLDEWDEQVRAHYKIPQSMWRAMAEQESGNNPSAVSPTGVRGRRQVTKATAKQYGYNRDDPFEEAAAAGRHLRTLYDGLGHLKSDDARWWGALAQYYGGGDAIDRDGNLSERSLDGISNPLEHVNRVARRIRGAASPDSQASAAPAASATQTQPSAAPAQPQQQKPATKPASVRGETDLIRYDPLGYDNQGRGLSTRAAKEAQRRSALTGFIKEFEYQKAQGDVEGAKRTAQLIKRHSGDIMEVGIGDGGWPYVKPKAGSGFVAPSLPAARPLTDQTAEDYNNASWLERRRRNIVTGYETGAQALSDALVRGYDIASGALTGDFRPLAEQAEGAGRGLLKLASAFDPAGNAYEAVSKEQDPALAALERRRAERLKDDPYTIASNKTRERLAAEEAAQPGFAGAVTRGATSGGLQALPYIGAGVASGGSLPVLAGVGAAQSDFVRPEEAALNVVGAVAPVRAARSLTPAINRAAQVLPGKVVQGTGRAAGQVGVGGGTNVAMALAAGERDPMKLAEAGTVGGIMSGVDAGVQARRGRPASGVDRTIIESAARPRSGASELPRVGAQDAADVGIRQAIDRYTRRADEINRSNLDPGTKAAQLAQARATFIAERQAAKQVQQPVETPSAQPAASEIAGLPPGVKIVRQGETPPARERGQRQIPMDVDRGDGTTETVIVMAPDRIGGQRVNETMLRPVVEQALRPPAAQPSVTQTGATGAEPPRPQPQAPQRPSQITEPLPARPATDTARLPQADEASPTQKLAAPLIPEVNQRLIERTRARADELIRQGQFDAAIAELRAHQQALRDAKALAKKAPGERARLEREIGHAGNRIGDVRRMKQEATRQRPPQPAQVVDENAPTTDLPGASRPLLEQVNNPEGGVPPRAESVSGKFGALVRQQAAQREAAPQPRRKETGDLSPVEYLKRATGGQGVRVSDRGEAALLGAKEAGIVGLTNRNSKWTMSDAQVMLEEGGFMLPDGRRFTDPSVMEHDVLQFLQDSGKQGRLGTVGLDRRLADEEAEYYARLAEEEGQGDRETGRPPEPAPPPPPLPRRTPPAPQAPRRPGQRVGTPPPRRQSETGALDEFGDFFDQMKAEEALRPPASETPAPTVQRPRTERLPVPKATDENIEALRARREELSRLAFDRRGEFPPDLADELRELGSRIIGFENEQAKIARGGRIEDSPPPGARPERMTMSPEEKAVLQSVTAKFPETSTPGRPITQEVQIPGLKASETHASRADARQGHFERFSDEELVAEIRRMEDVRNSAIRGRSKMTPEELEANNFDLKIAAEMQKERGRLQRQMGRGAEERIEPRAPVRAPKSTAGRELEHEQFGKVTESANQKGVGKGKLRVVDAQGAEHIIQNPRIKGNRGAAFVKAAEEAAPEAPAQPSGVDVFPAEARPLVQRMINRGEMQGGDAPEVLRWAEAMQKASGDRALRLPHVAEALQYRREGEIGSVLRGLLAETDPRAGTRSGMSRRAEDVLRAAGEDVVIPEPPQRAVSDAAKQGDLPTKFAATINPRDMAKAHGLPDDFYDDQRTQDREGRISGEVAVNAKYDPEGAVMDADFAQREAIKKGIYAGREKFYRQKVKDAMAAAVRRAMGAPEIAAPSTAPPSKRAARAKKKPALGVQKYRVTTMEPGKFREVEGEPVTIPGFAKDFQFFAHQEKTNGSDFITVISEATTGLKINQGKTREEAIKNAQTMLRRAGREEALKRIQEAPKAPQSEQPNILRGIQKLQRTPEAPVSISKLRAEFPDMSKAEFDAAMTKLNEEGRIALHRHDHPASLSETQRDQMVKIGNDYFTAATIREGKGHFMGGGLGALQGLFERGGKPKAPAPEPQPGDLTGRERLGRKIGTAQTMAQLLNPKTIAQNVIGNAAFSGAKNAATFAAIPVDKFLSFVTKKRQVSTPELRTQFRDFSDGFADMYHAVRSDDYAALADNRYELNNERVFKGKVGGFFEDALNIALRAPDRGAYLAAYNDSVQQILKAHTKSKTKFSLDKIHDRAKLEAQQAVFQDSNIISDFTVGLRNLLNKITPFGEKANFGLGDLVGLKYARTPANLVARGIEYSPLNFVNAFYKMGKVMAGKGKDFDQRAAALAFGKAFVGSAFGAGMGALLHSMGIITQPEQENRGVQAAERAEGLMGYQLNLSALKRYATGGLLAGNFDAGKRQAGDVMMSYDWMQPWAFSIGMGAAAMKAAKNRKADADTFDDVLTQIDAVTSTLTDQSILRNIKDAFKFGPKSQGRKIITDTPASFVPSVLNQARTIIDDRAREISKEKGGRGMAREALEKVVNRLPVASKRLPERMDVIGRSTPSRLPGKAGAALATVPGRFSEFRPHPVLSAMQEAGTGTTGISRKDGETEGQFKARRAMAAEWRREYGLRLTASKAFKDATPEERKTALSHLNEQISGLSDERHPKLYLLVPAKVMESAFASEREKRRKAAEAAAPLQ